jgi:hypothetical protein
MDATLLAIIRVGLSVLADRVLALLSLFMTFCLSCWVMYNPSELRLFVVGGFAMLVFVPSVIRSNRNERPSKPHLEESN